MPTNEPLEIDDDKLNSILDEVTSELVPVLKAEADRLAKAGDGPPPKEESSGEGEGSAPQEESTPSGPPSPSPSPEGSAPPPPAAASPAGAPPPGPEASAPPPGAPGAEGGMPSDPAQLAAMLAPLPIEQKKAIYMALKEQLFAAQAPPPGAAGPGAGAPPPMPPPGPPMPPPMGKGEFKSNDTNGDDAANPKNLGTGKMGKSENDELRNLVKSQGEDIKLLTKAIKVMVSTPMRKAITSVAALSKTEGGDTELQPMTKAELTDKLKTHSRNPNLSKTDRTAITKFYDSGSTNVNLIAHLLKQ